MPFAVRCCGISRCLVPNALCTRPLFTFFFLLLSPAVTYFPFLLVLPLCSTDPFFGVSLFPIAAGVGPRQQRMLRCRSSLDPPARLCRGESHSGASLALSPLLPGQLRARSLSVTFRTHSHPLPASVRLCPFHFAYAFLQPVPAIPLFPPKSHSCFKVQ